MAPRAARRKHVPPTTPELGGEPATPDEIDDLVSDADEHDEIQIRMEGVDTFRSGGSFDWVGPED